MEIDPNIEKAAQRLSELFCVQDEVEGRLDPTDLEVWQRFVADNDLSIFTRRLSKFRFDPRDSQTISADIGQGCLPGEWFIRLKQVVKFAKEINPTEFEESLTKENIADELPIFWEFLLPFAAWALDSIHDTVDNSKQILTRRTDLTLANDLLHQLSRLSSKVLTLELNICRLRGQLGGDNPAARFEYFARDISSDTSYMDYIFSKYSALARLLIVVSNNWVAAQSEMLNRFSSDRSQISTYLFGGQDLGIIEAIEPNLSDPHSGFRTTTRLHLSLGQQIVYKPRSIDIEAAFQKLIAWCNDRGLFPPLKTVQVLTKDGYGWVAHVDYQPCNTHQAVEDFFCRQGMNLCLMYALGATDMHFENVIANGEFPVIIDLETLFCPETYSDLDAYSVDFGTVLRTGFLPSFTFGDSGQVGFDNSGLGGQSGQSMPMRRKAWHQYRTDEMKLVDRYLKSEEKLHHLPTLSGSICRSEYFTTHIIRGFREMYHLILSHRTTFLSDHGPLAAFRDCPIRLVVRATDSYFELLNVSLEPRWMRSGPKRDIVLESLWRHSHESILEHFAQAEEDDLWRGDIPIFTTTPSSIDVWDSEGRLIMGTVKVSGYESMAARIHHMSTNDCSFQIRLIEAALAVKREELSSAQWIPALETGNANWTVHDFITAAVKIGDILIDESFDLRNGKTWIGLEYHLTAQHFHLTPLGTDLYNGTSGIALFLACLYRVTEEKRYRDAALATLSMCLEIWSSGQVMHTKTANGSWAIGGLSGIGGITYVLAKIGDLLGDERCFGHAVDFLSYIKSETINADLEYDIVSGTAGYLLALLELYRHVPLDLILAQAITCGNHLVRSQASANSLCWQQPWAKEPLAGMAHGASGISYALSALYAITREPHLLDSAIRGFEYEKSLFSEDAGNWPDLRMGSSPPDSSNKQYMTAWCHGATGIGYSRLGVFRLWSNSFLLDDLNAAVSTTLRDLHDGRDHLCCGLFGRLDFLFEAGHFLGDSLLIETVYRVSADAISRANKLGHWLLGPDPSILLPIPGLMQGVSGIGLTLLRFAVPTKMPNILLLK